eukprot:2355721-Pyramimonas_sp.AAC.1
MFNRDVRQVADDALYLFFVSAVERGTVPAPSGSAWPIFWGGPLRPPDTCRLLVPRPSLSAR